MPRTRIRTLASWAGAVALLALFATPAAAAIAAVPVAIGPDGGVLVMADAAPSLDKTFDFSLLRSWGSATATLHNSGSFDIGAMLSALSRSTGTSWMMQGAATCWLLLQGLYDFALAFEPINGFGAGLDQFAAGLAELATGPIGILALAIAVIVAAGSAVRATRMGGGGGLKRLFGVIALFAVITFAGNAATASTGNGDDYKPGTFSPGWVITSTNAGINNLSSGLAEVVNDSFLTTKGELQWRDAGDPAPGASMTCTSYVDAMRAKAEGLGDGLSATTTNAAGEEVPSLSPQRAQIHFLLSDLWQQSGIEAYKNVQFGSNIYADKTYCRLLEQNAGITEKQQLIKMDQARTFVDTKSVGSGSEIVKPEKAGQGMNTLSFDNDANRMAGMTAWAACTTDNWGEVWTVDPAWAKEYTKEVNLGEVKTLSDGDCSNWWNGTGGTDAGDIPDIFDVDGTPAGVAKAVPGDSADAAAIRDYLLTLNGGYTGGGGAMSALVYLLGSIATIIALGIVCVGTILAKLLGIFYVLALMLILIAGLFTANGWSKVKTATFRMIGSQLFAAGAVLILTFIVIFTNLLMSVGASLFDRGSFWALLWMGLAPAMALIGFNLIFKKIFRLPSPMSLKGGQLWANAAAAGGGGLAGSMLGGLGRGDGDPVEGGSRRLTRAAKEQLQKFGTPQDPSTREGAMGGGKRRTKLANAAAGDAAGAGAVAGGATAGAAAGAGGDSSAGVGTGAPSTSATGAPVGEAVTVPLGAPAAKGTIGEHLAAVKHAKATGKGGLAGFVVGGSLGAATKALASHRNIKAGVGYRGLPGAAFNRAKTSGAAALNRGKSGVNATLEDGALAFSGKQWRKARNAQGQMVYKHTRGVAAVLEKGREKRFQSLAASRGIDLNTATTDQRQQLRRDSAAPRAAAAKIAAGAKKAYADPKTMSRVKTAAKVGAGAAAIGLTGGLAAAPIAAFAAHKAIGKSRSYLAATRKGEHQADRLQAYRDAHAVEAKRKADGEAATAAQDKAEEKAAASEERIAASVAAKFEAAEAEKQKQAEANAAGAGDGGQQPSTSNAVPDGLIEDKK